MTAYVGPTGLGHFPDGQACLGGNGECDNGLVDFDNPVLSFETLTGTAFNDRCRLDQRSGEHDAERPGRRRPVCTAGWATTRCSAGWATTRCSATRGNDTLNGGAGTDSLDGGTGTDTCTQGETVTNCP